MSKSLPTSPIPKVPGYREPVIRHVTKSTPHFKVGTEVFLVKNRAQQAARETHTDMVESSDPITVYEVDGQYDFMTLDESEKKKKSLIKQHRDRVRIAARVFSIDNASTAEKNADMKWLLEHYSLDDILNLSQGTGIPVYDGHGKYPRKIAVLIVSKHPDVDFRKKHTYDVWSWSDRLSEYSLKETQTFSRTLELLYELISLRALESLVRTAQEHAQYDAQGQVVSLVPMPWIENLIHEEPIVEEMRDIIAVIDRTALGQELVVKKTQGTVHYWLVDDPKNKNPFKKL